ncbi:MAG: L-aspartate oxidase [Planctomycetota bacterium]
MRQLTSLVSDRVRDASEILDTDVLVIGGGVAGFSAAIAIGGAARVLVVTKDTALSSNTWAAQGGVAAVLSDEDSVASHRDDTLAAGGGLCEEDAVRVVVSEGPDRVRELVEWGGAFDRDDQNRLALTLEGGHSHRRILHARGDQTGMEVQETLLEAARRTPRVELWEHGFAVDLVVIDGRCRGAVVEREGRHYHVRARAVILATGGAGQIYRETTNPPIATADSFAMALRAGARLRDMEFVQFHPTTLYIAGSARHLITEAVRGEGGLLRDMRGERFMVNYHPDAELAPRDVVARSIVQHMRASGDGHVFIDLTHLDADFVRGRFPKLVRMCGLYDLDVSRDLIPVHPSVHYMMGGVLVDLDGRTEIPGLLACGEVASTGLHGANRLASNSLLEGLVFGRRAGRAAIEEPETPRVDELPAAAELARDERVLNIPDMFNSIKSLMWKNVGIVRDRKGLTVAVQRLEGWSQYVLRCRFDTKGGRELVNVLTTATAIARSALARRESRFAHFRTDHPVPESAWAGRHTTYPFEETPHE